MESTSGARRPAGGWLERRERRQSTAANFVTPRVQSLYHNLDDLKCRQGVCRPGRGQSEAAAALIATYDSRWRQHVDPAVVYQLSLVDCVWERSLLSW